MVGMVLALIPVQVGSHPAHAKPVNYPFVVGFERFYSSWDDDAYMAQGGLILLNELNCVACHAPPESVREQLSGVEATDLRGVGTRLGLLDLEIMIRNPRFVKKDTMMPSLFAGPDRDLEEVKALKHFLAGLTYELPEYDRGDIEAGRQLYHRIGCVACHAPEVGFRPERVPENAEIEMAGLPSVPMNLADLYNLNALTHFLLKPNEHRPSGRMPDFQLTEAEASDIAAYLKAGPDLILPENLTTALEGDTPFELNAQLAEKGRHLFSEKRCVVCHSLPESELVPDGPAARPLIELNPESDSACLADRPAGGAVPFFGLDEVQKRAISVALRSLRGTTEALVASEVEWRMKQLNCYACHERDDVGGVETAREVYFGFESRKAIQLGRQGHLPPVLDAVGGKLTEPWMEGVLFGDGEGRKMRPYMSGRMPVYRRDAAESLLGAFRHDASEEETVPQPTNAGLTTRGGDLYGLEGKNCQQCHGLGEEMISPVPGIDLSETAERLRWSYFFRLLSDPQSVHTGVPMPGQFEAPGDSEDIEALWEYLKSVAP